jgi:hypothetical protein|tara:strand:+ start:4949 stop:5110 length:162 start_codon:yes stop_codon:yes gene_type:complete
MNGGVYGRELIITVIGTQDTADRIRPVMAQLLAFKICLSGLATLSLIIYKIIT